MRGDKPHGASITRLAGGRATSHRPEKGMEPAKPLMDTTPPKRLTGVALDTWTRLAQQLVDDQTLTEASYVEFVAYCDAVADYEHARVELDKREGSRVAKTSNGAEQQIPELSMANRALETLLKLG